MRTFGFIASFIVSVAAATSPASARTNLVIFLADDLGYTDLGSFGAKGMSTPNLDRLAQEGVRLNNFYVTSPICSPSRASLLTGKYHVRLGINDVFMPLATSGLDDEETTIAEILKRDGYATGIVGKWHLGDGMDALPLQHGFDFFFGLPHSADMSPEPRHNANPAARRFPPLALILNNDIIEEEPDQSTLIARSTDAARQFISDHADQPFFLYVPYSAPHVPLIPSAGFAGRSAYGPYGDVVAEMDGSIGEILAELDRQGLADQTLVVFASDNGPDTLYGRHGGTCGALRGLKGTVWECGVRVPFIARWPGTFPAGREVNVAASAIDVLPTFLAAIESVPPSSLDGENILPLLTGEAAEELNNRPLYFYHRDNQLQAVRSGEWKLVFPHEYRIVESVGEGGAKGAFAFERTGRALFNLAQDPAESENLIDAHPDIVAQMEVFAEKARRDLGDSLQHRDRGLWQRVLDWFR